MKKRLVTSFMFGVTLWSSTAFPLGLELEFGGKLGKEKVEPRTTTSTTQNSSTQQTQDDLRSPFVFGGQLDTRLLVMHSRAVHLGLGAGFGFERGSASASLDQANGKLQLDLSYYRFLMEPNVKFTYFVQKSFGLGLGLGYYFGLTGDSESKLTAAGETLTVKSKLKSDSALRLHVNASFVLSGNHRPQIQAGYQFTGAGTIQSEGAEKSDLSGHSFVLSYIYPIIFENGADTEGNEIEDSRDRRGTPNVNDRNQRRRKPRPRPY